MDRHSIDPIRALPLERCSFAHEGQETGFPDLFEQVSGNDVAVPEFDNENLVRGDLEDGDVVERHGPLQTFCL